MFGKRALNVSGVPWAISVAVGVGVGVTVAVSAPHDNVIHLLANNFDKRGLKDV